MFTIHNKSTFYVSQVNGNDYYSGFSPICDSFNNGPFKTIEKAIQMIQYARFAGVTKPLTIALVDDYFLSAPLQIPKDVTLVTITSTGATKKRILGGVRVGGWQADTLNGHDCLSAEIPTDANGNPLNVTDLFINGHRAQTTRFPKSGTLKLVSTEEQESGDQFPAHGSHCQGTSRWFLVNPDDLADVEGVENAIIHYYHYWIDEHSPIKSYDRKTGKLTMLLHSRFSANALYERHHGGNTTYYLTGIASTFSAPDEWYFDKKQSKIYYIPANETITPDTIEAIVPTLDRLIDIEGDEITIENLELCITCGDYISTRCTNSFKDLPEFLGVGGDIQSVCWAPAAITFRATQRCTIQNCHLHGLGIHGISIEPSCRRIRIEGNEIEDICAGGIKIEGGAAGEDEARMTSDCIVRRNHIHHCGKRYEAGCGVLVMHASYIEICENEIHDLEYSGISVGWLWGYAPSSTYGNRICGNHIYNIGNGNLSDMGGIYTLGPQKGTVIADNRIHDVRCQTYGAWGIYLDEGSGAITVERNVVYRTQNESFHLHYGQNNVIKNNIFFAEGNCCVRISKYEQHNQIAFENNILITDGEPFYFRRGHSLSSCHNILWNTKGEMPAAYRHMNGTDYSFEEWLGAFGQDKGSLFANPKILGLADYDFTLAEDSPAISLGFIPLSEKVVKPKK